MSSAASGRTATLFIIACALGGAGVSGTLLKAHDGGWQIASRDGVGLIQYCNAQIIPNADCPQVMGSRWGSFDARIGSHRVLVPTSLIGLAYFVAVAVWFGMVSPGGVRGGWTWPITILAVAAGLAGSLFLVVIMAVSVSRWCPLCVVAHLLNGAIVIATLWLWRRTRRSPDCSVPVVPGMIRLRRRLAWSAATVALGAAVGFWLYFDAVTEARRQWRKYTHLKQAVTALQDDPQLTLRAFYAQEVVEDLWDDRNADSEWGVSTLRPRLTVFTDYDCGPCACFESTRERVISVAFTDGVDLQVRYCPETTGTGRADVSTLAASCAAEAARRQGGSDAQLRMHRLLFIHRQAGPQRDYADLARQAGLDVDRFLEDWQSEPVREAVLSDIGLANSLKVSAPAVFLEGRRVPDLCVESPTFWEAVSAELAKERVAASSEIGEELR